MPPSQKTQDSPSTSPTPDIGVMRKEERKPGTSSTTTTTTTPPRSSSIPTLPDVHKAPSTGPQGNFLQSLLMEDKLAREEEKENEEEKEGEWSNSAHGSGGSTSGRSGVTKKKGKVASQEGQGHRLSISDDRSTKTPETLTARSDKILTASWSGGRESSPRGQRRRRSRDAGTSGRRLSGPVLPFKKKFKHRLSQDSAAGSQRRYSSPATSSLAGSSKLLDLRLKSEGGLVLPLNEKVSSRTESESTNVPALDSEKCASDSAHIPSVSENPGKESSDSEEAVDSDKILPDIDEHGSDSTRVTSDPKGMQTLQSGKSHSEQTSSPSVSTGTTPLTSGSPQITVTAPSEALTSSTQKNPPPNKSTEEKAPEPSEAFNQWTTCRALEDSDDDNDNDDKDNDRTSEMDSHDFHSFDYDGYASDGRFSRAGSSNPTRRKRPLLLPPIMLPPLHTAKPTPMILRDEVYFATVGSRARRSLSEEEWEKLKDCRYLRIRPWRRPLKV